MARTIGSRDLRPRKPRADVGIRRRDANAEARIQAAIVQWIRLVAPQVLVFHVPNGGLRTKAEAAKLKWVGVVPGVPDLVVIVPKGLVFLMEVKPIGGHLTGEQPAMFERLQAMDIPRAIVRSIEDARWAFAQWDIPTREAKFHLPQSPIQQPFRQRLR